MSIHPSIDWDTVALCDIDWMLVPISDDGFRFEDLKQMGVVKHRSDMMRLQRTLNFPRPVKVNARAAWIPASWVRLWIRKRALESLKGGLPPPAPPAAKSLGRPRNIQLPAMEAGE